LRLSFEFPEEYTSETRQIRPARLGQISLRWSDLCQNHSFDIT